MKLHQRVLIELLSNRAASVGSWVECLEGFSAEDLANLYVDGALLASALPFISEENWLQSRDDFTEKSSFRELLQKLFKNELAPLSFLRDFLETKKLEEFKALAMTALQIEVLSIEQVKQSDAKLQRRFATQALKRMSLLFQFEHQMQLDKKSLGLNMGLSIYRTFDRLDEIFELTYQSDIGMRTDLQNSERLYEGAGVGVQSGYSTVLTALHNLSPMIGARFIDLGSGYGRVGLVVGLLRPDIQFLGFEYVQHRVDISNSSSQKMGLGEHVHFFTQDLSLKNFEIPIAEIYYLYDPFSEETYAHVLAQLAIIARDKKITIVTKGNARHWLLDVAASEGWAQVSEFDSGNLCIFYS